MILSDKHIQERLRGERGQRNDALVIDPLPPEGDKAWQPASVDLRLGMLADQDGIWVSPIHDLWILQPGEFKLASTVERVRIPADIAARVEGKSSVARNGVLVHITAGFIDPGFDGQITLEMVNLSSRPVVLQRNQRVCQITFLQMTGPADNPYGSAGLGSNYQGQRGPTVAVRIEQ